MITTKSLSLILSFLIFTSSWSPLVAAQSLPMTRKVTVFIQEKSMADFEFEGVVKAMRGVDLVSWMHTQKSLQDIDNLQVSEDPQSTHKLLLEILKRPLLASDVSLWLDLYSRIEKLPLGKDLANLASSLKLAGSSAGPGSNPAKDSQDLEPELSDPHGESHCSKEILVDGKWNYSPREGIHQWNEISNCAEPKIFVGTRSEFLQQKNSMHLFSEKGEAPTMKELWGLVKLEMAQSGDIGNDMPSNGESSAKIEKSASSNQWIWWTAAAVVVVGASAYALKDKDISFSFLGVSF
jgi:hypothetical protein